MVLKMVFEVVWAFCKFCMGRTDQQKVGDKLVCTRCGKENK